MNLIYQRRGHSSRQTPEGIITHFTLSFQAWYHPDSSTLIVKGGTHSAHFRHGELHRLSSLNGKIHTAQLCNEEWESIHYLHSIVTDAINKAHSDLIAECQEINSKDLFSHTVESQG